MQVGSRPSDTAPRRQERGRRRIEAILDAAEDVFAEVGYEAATTNLIASRAGISPGSLYQYFASKQAIAESLAGRCLAQLAETQAGVFDDDLATISLDELVDRVIDPMLAFNLAHPGAKALLVGGGLSPELTASTQRLHNALCGQTEVLIGMRTPGLSPKDRALMATVTIQIYAAVLPAILAATPRERPRLIRELKTALVGYWTSVETAAARSPAATASSSSPTSRR